jgi:PEP-CTERM motif
MKIKWVSRVLLVALAVGALSIPTMADGISATQATEDAFMDTTLDAAIANDLLANSTLPISAMYANDLAINIVTAQIMSGYGSPLSLEVSIDSVLLSIKVWGEYGATCVSPLETPWVFVQSELATNPLVTVGVSVNGVPLQPGQGLNFGTVPVGSSSSAFTVDGPTETPEPSSLLLLGSALTGAMALRRKWLGRAADN